jgi:N-dimethylarginine dimethylaminohydrolase
MSTYSRVSELNFIPQELPPLAPFSQVEMADPGEFDVQYAINPHMLDSQGALQKVNRPVAASQWSELKAAIQESGLEVRVTPALVAQPDFVFCANPGLPIPAQVAGSPARFVPSRMASKERAGEVQHWCDVFEKRGWSVEPLVGTAKRFEGTGDGIWHPRRRLLWGGIGPRTEREAWEELSERYDLPIVLLELQDPGLYHLDTCLAALSETTCLWCRSAFSAAGAELIEHLFEEAIEITDEEAKVNFAGNAFAPDAGRIPQRVLIQRGSPRVVSLLNDRGFECVEVETGEYMKSGGSVFCMKLAHCAS